jgi:Cu(I)/Ag(I) efflux system membrane fusion protein
MSELKADSSIVTMAKGYLENITAEAKGLVGEKDLDGKRKSFQMISDNMYDLVRTVRYDREIVYHQYCPMAFNDAGAYWLSKSSDIKNPYFGKKMLTCGEVKDSLSFSQQ